MLLFHAKIVSIICMCYQGTFFDHIKLDMMPVLEAPSHGCPGVTYNHVLDIVNAKGKRRDSIF